MTRKLSRRVFPVWLLRVLESIKGLVFGIVLLVGGWSVLTWNEGRAIKRFHQLRAEAGAVSPISANEVDPKHEGQLVFVQGPLTVEGTLTDPLFKVTVSAVKLQRHVEMFQWREHRTQQSRSRPDGTTERSQVVSYSKDWSPQLMASADFDDPDYKNPTELKFADWLQTATHVRLGAFALPAGLVSQFNAFEPHPVTEADRKALPADLRTARIVDGAFYFGEDSSRPAVGDTRVRFLAAQSRDVSVLAKQAGASFVPWYGALYGGQPIEELALGKVTAQQLLARHQPTSELPYWVWRGVAALTLFIGLAMLLPMGVPWLRRVPVLNRLPQTSTWLNLLLAPCVTLGIVGWEWMPHRTWLGVLLFVPTLLVVLVLLYRALHRPHLGGKGVSNLFSGANREAQ